MAMQPDTPAPAAPGTRPRSGFNLSRWALDHPALTGYLLVVLMVLGVAAYFQLGQDEDPPFTFRAMVVQAAWPGATAAEVADQVTSRIEKALQEVPFADRIRSFTRPGESVTIFQVKESTPPKEVASVFYQARKRVGDMRQTLPAGVVGPAFNDDFGEVYGSIYALSADGFSQDELRQHAEMVRDRFLQVPDVARVQLFGVQPERVYVEFSQRRLDQLGLDLQQLAAQIGARNAVETAGALDTAGTSLVIRVGGSFRDVEDLRSLPIRSTDPATGRAAQYKLGDVARIERRSTDPPTTLVRHDGRQVIAVGIAMTKGGDIIELGRGLRDASRGLRNRLPAGIELEQVQDQPRAVTQSVDEFVGVLFEALVIVLAVSFVSLGLHLRPLRIDMRPGLVVAVTIPLVLAITFVAMYYWGIGLHKISLGSLIIALGLLVDDAIIAVEMMVRKIEEGHDKRQAATFAYEVTALPMLTGTLITAAGFLPIGLARSTTGEYTFAIFAVTSVALVISWVASVYFVPHLGYRLLRSHRQATVQPQELFDTPFYSRFRSLVQACVRHRWVTIGATALLFGAGLFGMSRVQQQFFPDSSRPEILVDLWLPEGSTIEESDEVARRFETRMLRESGLQSVTTWVGGGVPRFYLPLDVVFDTRNVSQAILLPKDLGARDALRSRLPTILAEEFPEVRGRVKLLPNGPPVLYPVQFRLRGDDPLVLRAWAEKAKDILRAHPHARNVNDNWNERVKSLRLDIDQDKARALGVSSQSLAQAMRMRFSGTTVGQFRDGDRLLDIVLRHPADERRAADDLRNAYVPTASGSRIPLAQLATPRLDWEDGLMWREGRRYAITIQADVGDGVQGPTVSGQVWPQLSALAAGMPDGYGIDVAGAAEESSRGQKSIAVGLPAMLFIIFTLLMLQLQSVSRAVLVFLTGPLGVAGVAMALLVLDRPFGFVALLGVIALTGMIMRNAVILIDQIEQDRARGVPAWDAIVEAAVRRFRPIVLTAAAAVLAMIPLSRSVFWGPMAVAIMGGLIVATALTLLSLPAMYAAWFRVRREGSGVRG